MTAGALTLSNVHVRRCGRTVLQIDRLEVPAGDFIGIVGPNGAGKTTLLKVCAGLIRPDAGVVRLEGLDLTRLSAWRKCTLRQHIGYIPQVTEYNADLPFTVREVVAMGRTSIRPLLMPLRAHDREIVDHWIDAVGLADRRNQTFRSLSGGEQQKVLIARAMAQDPRLLMLDEACANLDFHWKHEVSSIVDLLYRQKKMTILMVSHETGVLPEGCRRAVLLADGRLVADGAVGDILSPEMLHRAYRADLTTVAVGGRTHIVRNTTGPAAGGDS
jgi:iron complex transport system ATP-binding protein